MPESGTGHTMPESPEMLETQSTDHQGIDHLAHLRPSSGLEMMDRVFAVYRQRATLFTVLGALYALPSFAVTLGIAYFYGPEMTQEDMARIAPWAAGALLLAQWPNAATISAAFQTLLFPTRKLAVATAIRGSSRRLLPLVLTRIVVLAVILMFGFGLPSRLLAASKPGILQQTLAIWMIVLAVFLAMSWALVPAVVMIERRMLLDAMARGFELMRVTFRKGFPGDGPMKRLLVLALFPISAWLVCRVPVEIAYLVRFGTLSVLAPVHPVLITADAFTTLLATAFLEPWIYIAMVVLYCECRMRREGFDIQMRLLSQGEHGQYDESRESMDNAAV